MESRRQSKVVEVIVVAVSLLMMLGTVPVFAQEEAPSVSQIAAAGRGEVMVTPDRAVLMVRVENTAGTASAAASENARLVASAMKRLREAGATDQELRNGGYSVEQNFDNGDRRRPRGFTAHNNIRIEVPRVENIGRLIDAALAGGATSVSPIQYLGPGMANARREALKAAVLEARRDAEALAEASGGSLGRLLSMTTGIGQSLYGRVGIVVTAMASGGTPTSITPADLVVDATANGKWEFVSRR